MSKQGPFHGQKRLRVLVDQDQVLCDFEGSLLLKYREKYPNEPFIALEDRKGFYARDQYAKIKPDLAVSRDKKI